jgi:hypothetical protein
MKSQAPPRFESSEAEKYLNKLLGLPYQEGMQDWAIELADPSRVAEFCAIYESGGLNAEEKFALMRLIVASLDDLLNELPNDQPETTERVEYWLCEDFALHLHTVHYWCLPDEADLANVFSVTPLVRRVWQECFKLEYQQWLDPE